MGQMAPKCALKEGTNLCCCSLRAVGGPENRKGLGENSNPRPFREEGFALLRPKYWGSIMPPYPPQAQVPTALLRKALENHD